MTHKEAEAYFETPEKVKTLIEICEAKYFKRIDYNANLFINHSLTSPQDTTKVLDELTGYYMLLIDIYLVSCEVKKRKFNEAFNKKKLELTSQGIKVTSTILEKEADQEIATYRMARNKLEANVNKCTQAISTCQSKLKYWAKEVDLAK